MFDIHLEHDGLIKVLMPEKKCNIAILYDLHMYMWIYMYIDSLSLDSFFKNETLTWIIVR